MIICDYDFCTGCSACVNACPVSCIELAEDEYGETHPQVDESRCVRCMRCIKTCPGNSSPYFAFPLACHAAWLEDIPERAACASGGLGTAIAQHVIARKHGVVFGTIYDEKLQPVTCMVDDLADIGALKGSKYTQSFIGEDVFKQIQECLKAGRYVAYIATPCQVAGLLSFLGGSKDGLLTVDLICHGVSPSRYLREELAEIERHHDLSGLTNVRFRGNDFRTNFALTLWRGDDCIYRDYENPYLVGFMHGISLRENCYSCRYARPERVSDVTIGDFIGLGEEVSFPYESENVSCVLLNTLAGNAFYKEMAEADERLRTVERTYEERLKYGPSLRFPFERHELNGKFRDVLRTKGYVSASREVIRPIALRQKMKRLMSYSHRIPRRVLKELASRIPGCWKGGAHL